MDDEENGQGGHKHKLFFRYYPFALPPERDDSDQGAYFDDEDDFDAWEDED